MTPVIKTVSRGAALACAFLLNGAPLVAEEVPAPEVLKLERVVVEGYREGWSKALQQKRHPVISLK
jgi:hypothetical protein